MHVGLRVHVHMHECFTSMTGIRAGQNMNQQLCARTSTHLNIQTQSSETQRFNFLCEHPHLALNMHRHYETLHNNPTDVLCNTHTPKRIQVKASMSRVVD